MHIRRLCALLLGVWLAGTAFMWVITAWNLKSVDSLLASPAPSAKVRIDKLGPEDARLLLRHQACEQNRWLATVWENAQIALGIVVLLALFFGMSGDMTALLLGFLMLVAALLERWLLIPDMVHLGRAIDFLAPGEPSVERTRYWMFHSAYSGTEMLKAALGAIVSLRLLARRRRHAGSTQHDASPAA